MKADWHMPTFDERASEDPLAAPDIEDVGVRVDLRADGGERGLHVRLVELLQHEQALQERGIGCAIKDKMDSSCHACPLNRARTGDALGELCRLGMRQELVATELAAIQCGWGQRG